MSDQPQPPSSEPPARPDSSQSFRPSSGSPSGSSGYGSQPMFGPAQPMYPQQDLLPQEVQPGRSRKPLVLALIVVLVLIGGGVGAWLLLRDNGESNRAQYCAALKKLIPDNDLIGAVTSADASTLDEVKQLSDLAPRAVSKDWTTLNQAMASFQGSSSPDPTLLLPAIGAIQDIVRDANDQCGMDVQLPSLP